MLLPLVFYAKVDSGSLFYHALFDEKGMYYFLYESRALALRLKPRNAVKVLSKKT